VFEDKRKTWNCLYMRGVLACKPFSLDFEKKRTKVKLGTIAAVLEIFGL